ncbi:hypothetical protein [Bailinhaonella thermotolerans]|uniref:Uncharacterized protein n=1 Tax=Bailinhaonella thermotolerans TaxID=1070861 RepID=A0A3A4A1D6_9ACTN|nr:hypothetical protein [Bailinhaonella thermotolerans]RJL20183.1 hypothetical protein D5H75_39745 [Bailinhaonella thermotolerans]
MNAPLYLNPSDEFDANVPAEMAALSALIGQPTGTGDGTPADLLMTLRAVHAEMTRRQTSHRLLYLNMPDQEQISGLFGDPGPDGIEATRLARDIQNYGFMVGVGVYATYPRPQPTDRPRCRVCGCTEDAPCPGGCGWVRDPLMLGNLCSACPAGEQAADG